MLLKDKLIEMQEKGRTNVEIHVYNPTGIYDEGNLVMKWTIKRLLEFETTTCNTYEYVGQIRYRGRLLVLVRRCA